MKKNEIATTTNTTLPALESDDKQSLLVNDSSVLTFSSWKPKTMDEKKAYFNAISSPSKKLGDMINMEIELRHVYAETCEYINKESGEVTSGVRIVLIDKDGLSYNCSSIGVYKALSKVFAIFGTPDTWEDSLPVRVKQIAPSADRKVLTLEMV